MQVKISPYDQTGDLWGEAKRSHIIKVWLQGQFQRFLYQTLYVSSQMKDRKHIKRNFYSVVWVMNQGRDLGMLGLNNLVWGFAMAPHWLRVLVFF